jgi:hypothetical protein
MSSTQPLWTEIVNSIAGIITAATAILAAYIAWRKFIKEESRTSTLNRMTIFEWSKQSAELRATESGLEYHLTDTRSNRDKKITWTIPVDELDEAKRNIRVYPSDDYPEWGLFAIGRKMDWYYSKKLFKGDDDFKKKVAKMIGRSLKMAGRAE